MSIKTYQSLCHVSLCALKRRLNFQEKLIDLDLLEQQSSAYRKICPSGKVPCLIIDDFHLFESWAITEYLEDVFRHRIILLYILQR